MEVLTLRVHFLDEINTVMVVGNRILLTVYYENRDSHFGSLRLYLLNVNEYGSGHLNTQKGDHQPIPKDSLDMLVAFGESSRIYH